MEKDNGKMGKDSKISTKGMSKMKKEKEESKIMEKKREWRARVSKNSKRIMLKTKKEKEKKAVK